MPSRSRRWFLNHALTTLGGAGVGGALLLPREARATRPVGEVPPALVLPAGRGVTAANIEGPFHRVGAPFRAKVTPPFEPGTVLVVHGRTWSSRTRRPLPGATIDVWQANAQGRYDNDDPKNPPRPGVYVNRARVITDESGGYEFETIHPGRYRLGADGWRPAHVHYRVSVAGHRPLVTQLYFEGDPENDGDPFIESSLIRPVRRVTTNGHEHEVVEFDIVLEPA